MMLVFAPLLAFAVAAFPPPPGALSPISPVPSNVPSDGITVRGFGTAYGQATAAAVTVRLFARNGGSIDEATIASVVDALVRAGIARTDITTPPFLTGAAQLSNGSVSAVVRSPTLAMIQNGIAALTTLFPANSKVTLNAAEVRLTAADCDRIRTQAQAAAVRQARANAESVARILGVSVGRVLAVDYQTMGFDSGAECTYGYSLGLYGNPVFAAPEDYLRVRVSSSVTIRFAIR